MKITDIHEQIDARVRKRVKEILRRSWEKEFNEIVVAQIDDRIRRRQARGSRRPTLDAWIVEALDRHPEATWKELWQRLAAENSEHHDDVWIDGDMVEERVGTKVRSCKERAFRDRITAAKKARK